MELILPLISNNYRETVNQLVLKSNIISGNYFFNGENNVSKASELLKFSNLRGSNSLRQILEKTRDEFLLISIDSSEIIFDEQTIFEFEKFVQNDYAGFVYSDHISIISGKRKKQPKNEHQYGSIRDNFDFGKLVLIRSDIIEKSLTIFDDLKYSAFYNLWLTALQFSKINHIPKFTYSVNKHASDEKYEKQFSYVDPDFESEQKELEKVFTAYLERIGAKLPAQSKHVEFENNFKIEASVVIPVKNRKRTIKDAVNSALNQKTNFNYNIILVDNHSDDGTTQIIKDLAESEKRIVHLIPEEKNLNIGGCWKLAINSKHCGKFAVQLDSDDLYKNENTLQIVVDKFYKENCGMVIGSYILTDFNLKEIPPGLISHKEWTDENGKNNALRINGFGAPRAFYVPLLQKTEIPDVSYGEDYSVCLQMSREYKVGRIYEPIYLCRRWEGNTDSSLSVEKENENNFFKDLLRTNEILERIKLLKNYAC